MGSESKPEAVAARPALDNVHVIVSPPCANKQGGIPYRAFMDPLKEALPSLQLHMTEYAGQATEVAKACADGGASMVISVGGDGTLSETVNGLVGGSSRLGILPLGRGNDYYRALLEERGETYNVSPAEVVRRLTCGNAIAVDIGRFYYTDHSGKEASKYFIVNATVGFSAAVTASVSRARWAGKSSYFLCLLTNLLSWKNKAAEVSIDGQTTQASVFNLNFALGRYYGTAMVAAPRAKVADGLVDVVCMDNMNPLDVIRYMPNNYTGDFDSVPKIKQYTGRNISVTAPEPIAVQLDGDYVGTTPSRVELLPSALHVSI